jgi:hypothetical protein
MSRTGPTVPEPSGPSYHADDPLFIRFDELAASARAPEYLVHGLVERAAIGVVFGDSDTYKTFAVSDLLMHIAAGKDWHGRHVDGGGGLVLYLNAEGHAGIARRTRAWSIRHDIEDVPFYSTRRAVYIDDDASIKACVAEVDTLVELLGANPVAIGIDTLARSMRGDENSTIDMNKFIANAADVLRDRYGASVLIVHHVGHTDKRRERGAYSLIGAVDARYLVERPAGTKLVATLTPLKMKDAVLPPPFTLALAVVDLGIVDAQGDPVSSLVIDHVEEIAVTSEPAGRPKAKSFALQILERLIGADGVLVPKVARTHHVVTEEQWRKSCANNSLSDSLETASQERAFRRARKMLLETRQIVCKQGYVWLASVSRTTTGQDSDGPQSVRADNGQDNPPSKGCPSVRAPLPADEKPFRPPQASAGPSETSASEKHPPGEPERKRSPRRSRGAGSNATVGKTTEANMRTEP